MRGVTKPINMVAWFDKEGIPHPIKFQLDTESDVKAFVKVDRVVTRNLEKSW